METTAVILMHEPHEGPGLLEPALREVGFRLVHRFRQVQPSDRDAALVVVMGGPMAVYEANQHDFLRWEIELLKSRLNQARPCLGICLGAQLLAAAAGVRVYPGSTGPELGVFPVSLTAEAATDPVLKDVPGQLTCVHWHQDTFDPVPGSVHLASTDGYSNQAYRIGRSYGFQFHPEVDAGLFQHWIATASADVERWGQSAQKLLDEDLPRLRSAEPQLRQLIARLAEQLATFSARPQTEDALSTSRAITTR